MTTYWCERAWLPDGIADAVRIEVDAGKIASVTANAPREGTVLNGLTLPGFANGHSHAFHRALRGRTHHDRGTFWTWRERMYSLASRLDPDTYYRLARGVYAEMVLAGYTSVGEFHYLHHAPGGKPYREPNAMGEALRQAARDAGIRLTLLDTCYLAGGIGVEPDEVQQRFSDGSAAHWARRVGELREDETFRVGGAIHSVRAVPEDQLSEVDRGAGPLHIHLSEQRGENEQCLAAYGRTPTGLLHDRGVLGERLTAVHATHLTPLDIEQLGEARSRACFCPTTERDLGDGIGPARTLLDAGVRLSLGSDSNAVVDAFEETRALELNERLASEKRGRFTAGELLAAATDHGAIGWDEVGELAVGAGADLVTVGLASVRTAGIEPSGVVFAASGADVRDVVVAGREIVRDGAHQLIDRPETVLAKEIEALWQS
ncbi:formimidoylglutamate deiminase [Amycolatopsis sp. WAC 01375]|uniref:formimidoylglutamate deiminase n=1 Tax=unclassified Amycolatopsis TaxID=2618356 RepID=UPI000F78BE68|nr:MULTISPECIES: formimidoylglutamate deiminase [unclassified Amycolatopsis]RSM70170.1 formimidoylglutamate deiminase [Amycolatopsis sp. WAC 01375]RSN21337.1 formimidoylglutamate deiminase [Amycolatopsis sp. WAC 01416]